MSLKLGAVVFDCEDALVLGDFWAKALGRKLDEGAESDFASIGMRPTYGRQAWLFAKVPEGKVAKNRSHPDLVADDRAAEVERLVGLGVRLLSEHDEWGVRWTVMQDVEGNEFCVAGVHQPTR